MSDPEASNNQAHQNAVEEFEEEAPLALNTNGPAAVTGYPLEKQWWLAAEVATEWRLSERTQLILIIFVLNRKKLH